MAFTLDKPQIHEARWWETMPDGRLHCYLCPRHCHIGEGQNGFCFIRKNEEGRLVQLGYGRPAAVAMDPIEKKPLNHFFPGTKILSMGTAGCMGASSRADGCPSDGCGDAAGHRCDRRRAGPYRAF